MREQIDFEQSKLENRTAVKPTVDLELDEKKRFYQGINALLSAVARDLAERIPAGLPNQLNVIYFPQIGYLIAMPMDPDTGAGYWEGTEDEHWEKMFTSDRMVYYKTDQMTEMDSEFGDIYTEICGE
jgi:DNA mismatch repair protein MSH5